MAAFLTKEAMRLILEQATIVLGEFYVHLEQKRARHAFDPLQALRLLEMRVDSKNRLNADEFHDEMFSIFNRLKDNHTYYEVRDRNRGMATLPFIVRRSDDNPRGYWVTHLDKSEILRQNPRALAQGFGVGAEVILWNGVRIDRVVEINAANLWGANSAAYLAQGVKYLCMRPTHQARPPAEAFVLVTFRPASGRRAKGDKPPKEREARFTWNFGSKGPKPPRGGGRNTSASAVDLLRHRYVGNRHRPSAGDFLDASGQFAIDMAVGQTRRSGKEPYEENPRDRRDTSPFPPLDRALDETLMLANMAELQVAKGKKQRAISNFRWLPDPKVDNFCAARIRVDSLDYGYIRLYTFLTSHPEKLVREFARTLGKLANTAGLILDIRDNPGGSVWATEGILRTLSTKRLRPIHWEFKNSRGTLELVKNSVLSSYAPSIRQAIETGAVYSQGFPELQLPRSPDLIGCYTGKIVLVVSALCYSASDIFAASFQDHKLGTILGVHDRTGAGGAIVIRHSDLKTFFPDAKIKINPPVGDTEARKRLLQDGGSIISAWAAKGHVSEPIVSGPIDGRTHKTQPCDSLDWFVGSRDAEASDYRVSFLPWIAKDALLVYAKTPQAMNRRPSLIKELPDGISLSFSFRRTVRQGKNNLGSPLEDIGVFPDEVHRLTKRDVLLRSSPDLIKKAVEVLHFP